MAKIPNLPQQYYYEWSFIQKKNVSLDTNPFVDLNFLQTEATYVSTTTWANVRKEHGEG